MRIADELGLFEARGIDADVVVMDSASVATTALISGSVNFSAVNPTDVIVARARGQDMLALTSVYTGFSAVMVLSKTRAD